MCQLGGSQPSEGLHGDITGGVRRLSCGGEAVLGTEASNPKGRQWRDASAAHGSNWF